MAKDPIQNQPLQLPLKFLLPLISKCWISNFLRSSFPLHISAPGRVAVSPFRPFRCSPQRPAPAPRGSPLLGSDPRWRERGSPEAQPPNWTPKPWGTWRMLDAGEGSWWSQSLYIPFDGHGKIRKTWFSWTVEQWWNTSLGWWFQPSWKILVNGKDYPIYYGK